MQRIFYPQSIVVIGVSEKPDNLARHIVGNLRTFDYKGPVYAVGRQPGEVQAVPIVTSLDQVPDHVDLAVILTPAFLVPDLLEACGRKGILRAVIESGGFSEFSEEGRSFEEKLLEIARRHGIRFVGPNCLSFVNVENGVCLPFVPVSPEDVRLGPASVIAQSGAVSLTYFQRLSSSGVGGNKAVSIGNKTDLDETDYLEYFLADPGTQMVVLYLESISEGRRLQELARGTSKPIIVHKANRGQASHSLAFSHTAALADDDRIVDAALRQAGILRAESFRDGVAIAQALALPPVRGNDLVVISRSGGHAVVAADVAERHGFRLAPLPEAFAATVTALFPANVIAPTNPIDLGVIFDFDLYAQVVENTLRALAPDAVLLINTYGPYEAEGAHRLVLRVQEIIQETGRPIAFCAYSRTDDQQMLRAKLNLPIFYEVEEALRGLAASRDRFAWLAKHQATPEHNVPPATPTDLPPSPTILAADRALALCQAYGIPAAPWEAAPDPALAAQAADRIGFPVALKILSEELVHKSDIGGVVLGLTSPASVEGEARKMIARASDRAKPAYPLRLMVQRMAPGGLEVIVGGKRDPSFGPVVMFGLGGIFVEAFSDVAFRVAPLSRIDAEEMIAEVRGSRLLDGVRGGQPLNREALIHILITFSRLLAEHPRLEELEINPLLVHEGGVLALDARGVVGQ